MAAYSAPSIQDRPAVPFVGSTTGVTMTTFAEVADRIPVLIGALITEGTAPAGSPFFRYLQLNGDSMSVQVGVPVPAAGTVLPDLAAPFEVQAGTVPAGRYACLTHVGPFDDLHSATERLLTWANEQGLRFDMDIVDGIERWTARLEIYLTDPRIETDPNRFRTELAFKLAD